MTGLKRTLGRLLSLTLAFLMLFEASGNAFAYMVEDAETAAQSDGQITLTDGDGNVTEVDESWEESFPYGAFAFENSGLAVKEGESGTIRVYRLGGTTGRATAFLKYQPTVTQDENGEAIYDFAISAQDVTVSVEEPQPAAKYQPVGRPAEPQRSTAAVTAAEDADGWTLSADVSGAASYAWQVSADGGAWQDVEGADAAVLPADAEALDACYDYRCIYTDADGVRWCTDSLRGVEFVPAEEEVLDPMPADIDLNADPVWTPLELTAEGEDPYSAWLFELVFADGEWVKELHIDALTDDAAEAAEAAAFTIVGCEGGAVLDSASTLLLRIEDANDPEPGELGFTAELVSADKADGSATLMIRRTGGTSRPVTVKYHTADGTAEAGRDYAAAEGTLLFYGGIDELPVRVELIDDGVAAEDAVEFSVELTELQGDDGCTLGVSRASVALTNSGTGNGENNATRLYDPDAVDLSGSVEERGTAASSADAGETVVSGENQELASYEPVYSELRYEDGEMTTQVYAGNVATILFKAPQANAWTDTVDLAANKSWWSVGNWRKTSLLGAGETTGKLGSGSRYTLPSGIALTSKDATDATFTGWADASIGVGKTSYVGQMFGQFRAVIRADTAHDTAYLHGGHYDYSYTKPNLQILQGSTLLKTPQNSSRSGKGPLDKNWKIRSTDDWSNYYNPFASDHSGSFAVSGTDVTVKIEMHYALDNGHTEHENDDLNDDTMLAVNSLVLTRRAFAQNAFSVEFSTPNDADTAPEGGTVLSDYASFVPLVELQSGGVQGENALYVGSRVRLTAGQTPAGYYLSDVIVYQRTDSGWVKFDKFGKSVDRDGATLELVGVNGALTADDLTAEYKFRVVYARETQITVDLSPSLPRDDSGAQLSDAASIAQVLNGYDGKSDHGFLQGAKTVITYGTSSFGTEDYTVELHEASIAKDTLADGKTTLTFSDVNIQWVNFGLSSKDLLLVNGRAYPGNADIYLRESDLSGGMTVYYYHEDYQNALSAMKTTVSWIGVYWDGSGNGQIDGYFNESGNFVLDGSGDEFCGYLDAGEYNETLFAPKKNADGVTCQYFLKVCYTMIPRCLSVPEGADAADKAQVMPAFLTALNADAPAYSKATDEQRQYRYLISGKTRQSESGGYDYSADNHLMYTEKATAKSTVDIPLGGDHSPAALTADGTAYTWTPDFRGALLYPYAAPTPVTIENSVAGATEVTGDYALVYEAGIPVGYTYTGDGLDKMNGYLGSFTGSTTFALVSQEQARTVDETVLSTDTGAILAAVESGDTGNYAVRPDSVTLGGISTTPDASYLKEVHNKADSGAAADVDMDDSGSSMSEFNVDLGINLGGTEIGVTDAVTIVLDGNKVGFAIGVPLGSIDKDEGATNIKDANKEAWTQFSDFFDKSNFGGDEDYKQAKDAYKSAKSGGYKPDGSDFRSKSVGVEFSMSIAFMFEYNPLDDGFYFEGMTVSCAAEFSVRVQARLTVCPIVYFYMEFSAGIEATTGLGVIRGAEEGTPVIDGKSAADQAERVTLRYLHAPGTSDAIINEAAYEALTDKSAYTRSAENDACYWNSKRFQSYEAAKAEYLDSRDYLLSDLGYGLLSETEKSGYTAEPGRGYYNSLSYGSYDAALAAFTAATSYSFETDLKAFNLCFSGKLSVEVLTSDGSAAGGDYITGFLTSDGQSDTQVVLKKQEGMQLGETVRVVLRPMERDSAVVGDETQLSYLAPITKIRNEVYWKGIEITPSLGLEIGAGVGVELMKLELYAKVGLEATFLLGVYNEDYDGTNDKYKPASVESFEFSIGLGVRVVLLVFTFELDVATYTVEYEDGKWETGWHFLNDWVGQDSEPGYLGVTITPPKTYSAQNLYTAEDNTAGEMSTQAYAPADDRVPFQLSGYKTDVNAFALGDGLLSGTDYKAVSAGGRSFLFYTVSRSGAASEDLPMLVMSELTHSGSAYGLANPADADAEIPYLIVDDDGTGDLDFDVWTEDSTVHAAWVSYASASMEQSSPAKPDGEPYQTADGTVISADNYQTIAAPEKPADFTEAEPAEADYFTADGEPISEEAYDALDEAEQAAYVRTSDGEYQKYTPVGDYADYAAAKAAYDTAAAAYQTAKAAHDKLTEAYESALDSYNIWKTYYESLASYNAWAQNRLAAAAKNTVVKTASWSFRTTTKTVTDENGDETTVTVYDSDKAFSEADEAANTGSHLFAPAAVGTDAVFFGSAYALDENGAELEKYRSYLEQSQDDERVRNYLLQTEKSTLDVFGTQSALNAAFRNKDGRWTVSSIQLNANQTIGNIEVRRLSDGNYYVAYTTSVDCYERYGSEGKNDRFTEERLYLRRVTLSDDGSVDWGTPYVLRVLRSYDAQTEKDGLYNTAGTQTKAFESPYFSNLSFLHGKIDAAVLAGETESFSTYAAAAEHDLLLFEMNGTTYVILDEDLQSITTSGTGAIRPFFTGADGQVSGKLEVTVGADAEGNLFAVYTSAVEGTTNNAIYLASYDPAAGWSDGVILAMNGMDVYEQSAKNGWNEKLTQAAYWGLAEKNGLLTEAELEALFGAADGSAIYSALSAFDGAPLGNGRSVTLGALQAVAGSVDDLLILTQATVTKLAAAKDSAGNTGVAPAYRSDGTMDTSNGIYVIRYGRGEKALGEGSIAFAQADFSADSELRIEAEAVNVGDTAFYGSKAQPITVTLSAAGQELLKSEITQNILPGQTVSISGTAAALQKDLDDGDAFVLTVSEYSGEGYDGGVSKAITLYTVDLRPDLGVEQLTLKNPVVSADGSTTTYDISFVAANRGSAAAEGVFAQFSYADGEDADGSTTYTALDLTLTGTALTVDREKSLAELSTQAASTDSELKAGILHLYSSEDSSERIDAGNGRRVSGSLTVPNRAFAAGEAGALTLRVELFREGDSVNSTFITQSFHDEHYTANNAVTVSQSAVTAFTAAPSIVIPLGTTTLIPLSAVSSRGTKPSITVREIDDEDGENIGILNFKESRAGGGKVSGVISITPASLGHGILHVYDTATNSLTAIAFEVADSSNGIDIYNDNESFTFYQTDGEQYDRESTGADSDWSFTGASEWGQGDSRETPLRTNLSYGKKGAYFRFQSVAESIDLYFQGEIEVSTTHPEVADAQYTGEGGSASTTIELGSNPSLDAQVITIRVLSPNAAFDRLVEHYPGGVVPVPSFDRESPNLYWSRSFPATAAIAAGSGGVALKLYALDDGGVSYISVNGRQYTALDAAVTQLDTDGRLLCYDFGTITENGTYEVAVADTSGNITRETLLVDWFGGTASGDAATVAVPEYDADFFLDGTAVSDQHIGSKELEKLNLRTEKASEKEATELQVLCFGENGLETLTAAEDGSYPIRKNAIYWVYATNTDGTYSSRFLCMSRIDTEIPAVSLRYDALNGTLEWTAAKAGLSASPISTVTLNGKTVNTASGLKLSGSFATLYNGSYTLRAEDTAGNYSEQTLTVADAPLSIAGSTVQCIGAWNAERDNGAVELDLTGVTGGTWSDALSAPENGVYRAQYAAALLPGGFDTAKLDEVTDWVTLTEGGNMTHRFSDLALGEYLLVVRDAAQPERFTTAALTIGWEAIEAEAAPVLASYAGAEDGAVGVTVTNGRAANYEFAILPIPSGWDGKDLSIGTFLASAAADAPLTWLPADNLYTSALTRTFDGLKPGSYFVAVRGLAGASEDDLTALKQLGRTLLETQNALKNADSPTPEYRQELEDAVTAAQSAYDAAAAALSAKSEALYGTDTSAELWQRALVLPVTVGFYQTSTAKKSGTNENGSTIFDLTPGRKLTETDSSRIYKENRENDILLRRGGESVYLPAGTLTAGFDANRLLIGTEGAADGMVVQYTAPDGSRSLVPWCIVSEGCVSYFALGPGDYELVPADCAFTDISGLWGEESIRFAAHRALLSGVGDGLFAPQGTMTRAMFVTVLWRMAGCPAAETESTFTDLTADWYRAAVAWGAETGVVAGLSDTQFGPNYPVTREQMCVLLCRFAAELGLKLGSGDAAAFSDAGDISPWAMDSVTVCAANGLVLGMGNNTFVPKNTASRMEVSALFTRFITQMVEKYAPAGV